MISREELLALVKEKGRQDALDLQKRAPSMSQHDIIEEDGKIPEFDPKKDYTGWAAGSPVKSGDYVWILIIPHNAAHYTGTPAENRALWGLAHSKNPKKARPWVDSYGTSGLYMKDEVYLHPSGVIKRCLVEQTNYNADQMPSYWEDVPMESEEE